MGAGKASDLGAGALEESRAFLRERDDSHERRAEMIMGSAETNTIPTIIRSMFSWIQVILPRK